MLRLAAVVAAGERADAGALRAVPVRAAARAVELPLFKKEV